MQNAEKSEGAAVNEIDDGTSPGHIVVAPFEAIVPGTRSLTVISCVAVEVQPDDVPVTVKVAVPEGFIEAVVPVAVITYPVGVHE